MMQRKSNIRTIYRNTVERNLSDLNIIDLDLYWSLLYPNIYEWKYI